MRDEAAFAVSVPLVSIGIPTYNRPASLRRTLECITQQTYKHLEIIVSDNASPGGDTSRLVKEFQANDPRIRFEEQTANQGPIFNFSYVAKLASGKYFMWAADDDEWEPWYVEKCVHTLEANPKLSAAVTEAQFLDGLVPYHFFGEGRAFYTAHRGDVRQRLTHLVNNNYGNLIYSVFRKEALMLGDKTLWECLPEKSLNEIPVLLYAVSFGPFLVLPTVGFYKSATLPICLGARWEVEGGTLPVDCRMTSLASARSTWKYHEIALRDILAALNQIRLSRWSRSSVALHARVRLAVHYLWLILGWKPRRQRSGAVPKDASMRS
jgi:hypothetical protein